jgi:tRNA(Ile)-lysidine synthase
MTKSRKAAQTVILSYAGIVRLETVKPLNFNRNELRLELKSDEGGAEFDGSRFRWRIVRGARVSRLPRSSGRECFDFEKVASPVVLRHWLPGDRFHPIGSQFPVKLQDFFTNEKIPKEKRYELVVAEAADGQIFWVEGLRISERFKLTKSTKSRLEWQWKRGK